MATVDTAETTVETPVDPDTRLSARILRFLGRTPVHIVLVLAESNRQIAPEFD